jgi:hypothetical protein
MDKKTLALLGVALIVVNIVGLVLSSGYSRFTYRGSFCLFAAIGQLLLTS